MTEMQHYSVLLNECVENLQIRPDGIYVDGTLGLGGHSFEIAKRLKGGRLICIDKDEFAIRNASERLEPYRDRICFVHDDFKNTAEIVRSSGFGAVDGMLFDLGVSSPQLDDTLRGFSYMNDAFLDMRMDSDAPLSAYSVVNSYSAEDLTRILFDYGEERYARRIVAEIVSQREKKPIETTMELVEIIKRAMPPQALREKQHPAKRTFQAIRIEVNNELGSVSQMMQTAPDVLNPGGRLCVISFHSLEDRIVKNGIASRERGCTCPREAPVCVCGFRQTLKTVSRKPILPSEKEIQENPRSRSAKLRVAERV